MPRRASRHGSTRRPCPRSTQRGQKRGMRRNAPLLLLAAWLGVCSAKGTLCSVQPSVCSGTYSGISLCAALPLPPARSHLSPDPALPHDAGILARKMASWKTAA